MQHATNIFRKDLQLSSMSICESKKLVFSNMRSTVWGRPISINLKNIAEFDAIGNYRVTQNNGRHLNLNNF